MIRETELISLKDGKTKSLTEFVKDLAPTPEPMELTPTTPVDTGGADPVELSSYIDGIADTSASDAITAGLASGGSIKAAIDAAAGGSWQLVKAPSNSPNKTLTEEYQNITSFSSLNVDVTDKDYCINFEIDYTMNGGSMDYITFQKMDHMFSARTNNVYFGSIYFDNIGLTIDIQPIFTKASNIVKLSSLIIKGKIDDASKNCMIKIVAPNIYTK